MQCEKQVRESQGVCRKTSSEMVAIDKVRDAHSFQAPTLRHKRAMRVLGRTALADMLEADPVPFSGSLLETPY
jgi:hypothetical protein